MCPGIEAADVGVQSTFDRPLPVGVCDYEWGVDGYQTLTLDIGRYRVDDFPSCSAAPRYFSPPSASRTATPVGLFSPHAKSTPTKYIPPRCRIRARACLVDQIAQDRPAWPGGRSGKIPFPIEMVKAEGIRCIKGRAVPAEWRRLKDPKMSNEFEYEIARYSVQGDAELLIERAQLVNRNGAHWRRVGDEPETRCDDGVLGALIGGDPLLSEVRANQVTRIIAGPAALREIPLVLHLPGDSSDFDESLWSQAMVHEHLDSSDGTDGRGVYRVLYVNGDRWGAFSTSEGERLLPEGGDSEQLPFLDPCWGELSFTEGGAMMTVGTDLTAIGVVMSTATVMGPA